MFPELVTYETNGQDDHQFRLRQAGCRYNRSHHKEQQKEIEQLKEALRGQEEKSRENQGEAKETAERDRVVKSGEIVGAGDKSHRYSGTIYRAIIWPGK